MNSEEALMRKLIEDLRNDKSPSQILAKRKGEIVDLGLVNQFKELDFIPNKWFDWIDPSTPRGDSAEPSSGLRGNGEIMIIGQDWGPFIALQKYVDDYEISKKEKDFDYEKFLFKTFSTRTEKFILNAVEKTYVEKFGKFDPKIWNKFFFTVAVMFTRQGKHFRGNHNFDEKQSFEISYPYLSRQIDIVKPKIIMPIGGLAFRAVARKFKLETGNKNISKIIEELGDDVVRVENTIIIPNFHPAAHVDPKIQMRIWGKLWEYI